MQVRVGDRVRLRDGTIIDVTDAVNFDAPEVVENPDNILIGREPNGRSVVTNMTEVVSILE